jgi:hypothetical protein
MTDHTVTGGLIHLACDRSDHAKLNNTGWWWTACELEGKLARCDARDYAEACEPETPITCFNCLTHKLSYFDMFPQFPVRVK